MSLLKLLPAKGFHAFKEQSASHPARLLGWFILGYALIYTVLPYLFYQSVLPDSAQNIIWGHSWRWSYSRHPPIGTWLLGIIHRLLGNNELAAFSSSALCLSVSLIFIYKLSERYLGAKDALVATVFSTFSLYFLTNYALQFNQNTIMLPFWVMVGYFLDSCLRHDRWSDWLLLAIVSTAAMLAKYESLLIIGLAFLYLLFHFKKTYLPKLMVAFILSLILFLPHAISVAQNGYLTLKLIDSRMEVGQWHGFFYTHFFYPPKAFLEQMGHILPALVMLFLFFKTNKQPSEDARSSGQFNYLVYLGVAPLILVVLLALVLGIKIQAEWGFPIFAFTIPALMSYYRMSFTRTALLRLIIIALIFHLASLTTYKLIQYYISKKTRTSYPSYTLATQGLKYWQRFSDQPIKYIGGDEQTYYYLGAYMSNKPLLLEHNSLEESPWVTEAELKKHGLLLVFEGCERLRSEKLQEKFSAAAYACFEFPMSNKYKRLYTKLTLMVVPPAKG